MSRISNSCSVISSLLLVFSSVLSAQQLNSSPYSRYGLGEVNSPGLAQVQAMGGTFIAFQPDTSAPFFMNIANPAALSGNRLTTLELGGYSHFSKHQTSTAYATNNTTNFSYGSIGFPIKQFGGACIGLMPYSTVGFKVIDEQTIPNIGDVKQNYYGDGGLNKAFVGFGFKPFRNTYRNYLKSHTNDTLFHIDKSTKAGKQLISELSFGANVNYLFGQINQTTDVIFPGTIYYNNTRRVRSLNISDVSALYGIQTAFTIDSIKHKSLKHKLKIGLGAYVSLPTILNATHGSLIYNFSYITVNSLGLREIPKDTILNTQDNKGTIKLPLEYGVGLSLKQGEKLSLAADLAFTKWSQFRYLDATNELKDSKRVSIGLNYVPNKLAVGNGAYFKRIHYRLGASYSDGFIELKQTRVNTYAVTAGLGLPVGIYRQFAVVNISAQLGTTGSTTNNLVKENFARIILGFTFNDRWFIKYRYD